MRKILGLDLGTTSIGWAFVHEAEKENNENSKIIKLGVRVNPLTTDEQTNFELGRPITINADRTLKRSARRNLDRYQLRRENLIEVLLQHNIISENVVLAEDGKHSTHSTYALRAKAVNEKIELEDFGRILLMINKKRGYKSSRKAKNEDEGQIIDGMQVAKTLYENNLTPGQYCLQILQSGKKYLPDFYRSDLQTELDKIWEFQQQFYPDILTEEFKKEITGKGLRATSASFWGKYNFNTAENKGTRDEKKIQAYKWRSMAIDTQLSKEEVAYVIAEINGNINNSSGYLGAISDRSKELFFNNQTVGQYLFAQLKENPHARLKNQVFYRQDYYDEFEKIWDTQAKYHKELTPQLKEEIRDIIIFYQRNLKSQKSLISFCEFEKETKIVEKDGKKVTKTFGLRVIPRSSLLFQEFKIWQTLNNVKLKNITEDKVYILSDEDKQVLFDELNVKGNLKKTDVLKLLGYNPKDWEINYSELEGNRTNKALFDAYLKMFEMEGHEEISLTDISAKEAKNILTDFFIMQGIEPGLLNFNAELEGKEFEKQPSYALWHLLYSYEGDTSNTGNELLYKLLQEKFGFKREFAQILANITLQADYGNLSAKAIRKIYTYIKDNTYDKACALAGYNHSSSLTKEENLTRELKSELEILPKNSLRNPVVEKILNQMINVVNAIIRNPEMGKPDEIRIELARELKKNAKERAEMTSNINKAKAEHDVIRKTLTSDFGIKNPTRNDIIRYKLYEELKLNGYHTLYSNTYIPKEKLFSKDFDIEHIIPQAKLFDDSFSNKTIEARQVNLDKGNETAIEYVERAYDKEKADDFLSRIEMLYKQNALSKAKYKKLKMRTEDIGKGFIERDLRDSQYIARKAREILLEICRTVVPTTGSVTDKLREDWDLINVMQELNFDKYKRLGLIETIQKKDGGTKERIVDWTKRNDHRHHAMDALTVAFTTHNHIQYLNNLNARNDKNSNIWGIEQIITEKTNGKRRFKKPIPNFREEAKRHLETILVSTKSKTKVVTSNKNTIKTKNGVKTKTELTPRGQLHKETVYGKIRQYATKDEKIGSNFNQEMIEKVSDPKFKDALLKRLEEFGFDAKLAFTGKNALSKKPIYLDEHKTITVPEKVKTVWLEDVYTIRKDIAPELKIEKVIDAGIRKILEDRLAKFNGNAKEAFSNLELNPIWLNESKGIAIKRVTITGVKNTEPLSYKKDHHGKEILDEKGRKIPVDFVSTGNNHHVAIYRDEKGVLQDNVVSFFEAVTRANQGLPVIDKTLNQELGWQFLFSMKQNEYFVFPSDDFDPNEINLLNPENNKLISKHLYRVQKFSKVEYGNSAVRDYVFRHHHETTVEDKKELRDTAYIQLKSLPILEKIVKVRINHIGEIVKIGEY